jgi:hypothetical protein
MSFNVIRVAKATDNDPIKVEKPASATILPGTILLATATQFKPHDVANGGGMVFVADVNMHDSVSDAYAAGDTVQAYQPVSGEVYRLRSITAQAYVKDVTPVTSTGAGRIDIATGTDVIIGYADETVTTSAADQLVRIKFK